MEVWQSILKARQELGKGKKATALTIGNFDGVHLGHRAIIGKTVNLAREQGLFSVAMTFANHTESQLGESPLLINTPVIRRQLLTRLELDALLEVPFDENLARLSADEFLRTWLVDGLLTRTIVVGYDFRFGYGGCGDLQYLREFGNEHGIKIENFSPVQIDGVTISSSKIRQLLAEGQLELANRFLGYPFVIQGEVVTGEQRGRKLGYPTANIRLGPEYLLPCYGVYLVKLTTGEKSYYGIANVGIKPTFHGRSPLVEVYLFDIELNLYHHLVRVEFLRFIRPENRFSGPEALKEQIARDVMIGKEMIGISRL